MAQNNQILELMGVPAADHDLAWLKASLQAALQLEFATIPPYLTAWWSIDTTNDPDDVASSIREVLVEEMLHLGLVANLLSAVGGTPVFNQPGVVPTYPGPLPGGVHPGLEVALQGLTPAVVKLFMQIEYPENGPIAFAETFPTIGAFYTAIQAAFASLNPPLAADRQLGDVQGLGLFKITTQDQVKQAIDLIKHQGEGSKDSPDDTGPGDLAHFYRFAEIDAGKRLQLGADGKYHFDGPPVHFPGVLPVVRIPAGGYAPPSDNPTVGQHLAKFDQHFTTMLNQLQHAWETGTQTDLTKAVSTMYKLGTPATALMQFPLPGGAGNYGPCFRLVTPS
jgi:hypothetical protein